MKPLGGADSTPKMDITKLFTELRESSRGDGSRLQQRRVCDRILRLCVELMAQPGGCHQRATSLVTLAEEACQGYLAASSSSSSSSQPPPLYLEKILYHLLKNAAARGSVDACWRAADLLRGRLMGYQPNRATASKDFVAIAYNTYSLLWKGADVLAHPDRPREEGRGVLSVRLRALRFLLLLEEEEEEGGVPSTPPQPPFFNSQTAQQAATAAALYQAQQSPSPAFLARQIGDFLLAPLWEGTGGRDPPRRDPPGLRRCLCFFELTLERCRHLCKSGWFREAEKAVKEARDFLRATKSFGDPLTLLETGVQLSQALAGSVGQSGSLFSRAAVALGEAEVVTEPFLGVLAESCQLLVTCLGELAKRSKERPLGRGDTPGLCAFTQGHCLLLRRLLERVPPDKVKAKLMVKQLLYRSIQLFATLTYDAFQGPQPLPGGHWSGLEQLLEGCGKSVAWMVEALEGLPESERAKYLDVTVLCTFKLSYIFYRLDLHEEAIAVSRLLCQHLEVTDPYSCPQIPPESLHKCFRLRVENYRKLGRLEGALESVVGWLVALGGRGGHLLAEPLALWVRVKTEARKRGEEEIRLRTLRDALKGRSLGEETLVTLLLGELRAYKGVRGETGQERYDTLCHLLELCPPHSGRLHPRAVGLRELAQLLCYHTYPQQTEWSPLDSVRESLRLLELVPSNSQNRDQLLDDRAQALLWLYICTLESKLEKGIERDQRLKALGTKTTEDFEHNDLGYEGRLLEDKFLYDGVAFNLVTESDVCKHLDDAFSLWKQLLGGSGVPAVRCPEETVASLRLMAALYKLMAKPLQAMESYLLLSSLCDTLGDSLGTAGAFCQVTKLLLQLECPTYAQLFLEKTESCLGTGDSSAESYILLQQTCLLLRCQLCCANNQVGEGLGLLLGLLQNPTLRKATRDWYLLRAHVLQLVAVYLSLPQARLPPQLRQRIVRQGWRTPEAALSEAHKIFRSITILLGGRDIWGGQTTAFDSQFGHYWDNVPLKWEVLGDILACSEKLVAHLSQLEVVCKAKAFCLDTIKLAIKLQAIRWCGSFMVLKAQLELQQNELELSSFDLQQVLYLLESPTEFNTSEKLEGPKEIVPRKGKLGGKKPPPPPSAPPEEEEGFLKGPPLELVPTVNGMEPRVAPMASPELKPPRMRRLTFLAHPEACSCCLCSDPLLSALCLRWLLAHARLQLAQGNQTEGLGLIRALLPRCATVATRFATLLRDKPWGDTVTQDLPALELLNDLVATVCATLALQSLANPQLAGELERGFTLLASCRPHVPNLEVSRATLLLAKAVATACHRASEHDNPADAILASSCTFQLPTLAPEEPQVATVAQNLKVQPQRRQTKPAPAPPGPKPRVKKSQKLKPPSEAEDSDSEVATVAVRPATVPCGPPATPACRTPFTIFSESSPLATKSQLLRAPKASRRVKSRLKVTFSDNSDGEDPPPGRTSSATPKVSSTPKSLPPKSMGPGGDTQPPRRGRRGRPRARATEEKKERATPRAPGKRTEEKGGEVLRAIREEEEEKVEEELEVSFKVLQEEEEGAQGRTRHPRREEEDEGGPASPNSGDPLPLEGGGLCCPPTTAAAVPSLATVQELLQGAFDCISHCPPPTLYSHICRLLALTLGHRDPLATAFLLSESFSITTRHQLLNVIHRKIHKEKKAKGDIGDHLSGLSLQEGTSAQRSHHLTQLQGLFAFDAPGGAGREGGDAFRAHLQHIPPGVTVCLLTLANLRGGDTLLLTRLEKDVPPVTIPIPTARSKVPLSSILRDFDDILKGQREANACRDKQDWWLRRSQLDQRMKNLIENLERHVLGCWRGALLPSAPPDPPQSGLEEEAALLHPQLLACGWRDPQTPLLKVILNAAPLLAPPDVQALAFSLCPTAPQEAQLLLQKALKKRSCPKKSSGSLVLVLDKHLQKLPWESMGCLRTVPVTRLPSLRFLLAYSLAQKQGAGSVLGRGMNPTSAFYVLNPNRNLPGTEERFRDWFESEPGWRGVTGVAPSTEQMEAALTQHDLYIYVGHGAGARFLDGQAICRLDCRAVALLFGCSSAALALRGDLEASGIVLKYIMAGCPLVLGNLWDVTDRDLDRYAQALLEGWLRGGPGAPLLPHVTQARQAPRLKHLIGAAPVAYGLPVCLQ